MLGLQHRDTKHQKMSNKKPTNKINKNTKGDNKIHHQLVNMTSKPNN